MFKRIDLVNAVIVGVAAAAVASIWPIKCSHETVFAFTNSLFKQTIEFSCRLFKRFKSYKVNMKNYSTFPYKCNGSEISFLSTIHFSWVHDNCGYTLTQKHWLFIGLNSINLILIILWFICVGTDAFREIRGIALWELTLWLRNEMVNDESESAMRHILLLMMSSRLQQTHASVMIQTKRKVNIHELIYSRLKSKQKMVSFQVSDKWREPSINSGELDSIRIVSCKTWKGKKYKTYHGFTDEHSSEPNFNLRYFRFQILNLADLMHLLLKCIRCIFSKQKNKFSQNLEPIPNEMFILNDQRVNKMHKTVKISAPQIVEENFVE